jgi:hypothetical protein
MLKGVELHPGDAEEQAKENNRIEVVDAGDVEMFEEVAEEPIEAIPTVE